MRGLHDPLLRSGEFEGRGGGAIVHSVLSKIPSGEDVGADDGYQ